jgi:hypothetical protein
MAAAQPSGVFSPLPVACHKIARDADQHRHSGGRCIVVAQRERQGNGRREDPNGEFIAQVPFCAGNCCLLYRDRRRHQHRLVSPLQVYRALPAALLPAQPWSPKHKEQREQPMSTRRPQLSQTRRGVRLIEPSQSQRAGEIRALSRSADAWGGRG